MPNYEYLCEISGEEFEEFHSIKIVLEDCPLCKEAGREPHAPKRLISGGSGKGIVEQSFSEMKSNFQNDVNKFKRELYSSENKFANFVGEDVYNKNKLRRE
jgi:hypothetical protein